MDFKEPDRLFKIWDYTVSHQTLLLRSDTNLKMQPLQRIEIYVGGVQTLFMNSLMYGLELRRADEREAADVSQRTV